MRDTHDERDIFEFDDIDDDDDEFIPPRDADEAETEMELDDTDESCEYLEQAEAHYISYKQPTNTNTSEKPTKNLFANRIAAKYSHFVSTGLII